ncbi:MAG: hypothetical protein PVJ21_07750 [Anaerolineales bacterium]|jgi:hypothetical protein
MTFLTKHKRNWLPPLLFLAVLIFAFGVLLPGLGFYWDDWPPILIEKMQNTQNFWEFYQYDRPFSAWTYVVLFPILGVKPLAWQIFTLGLRWLTTVFVWLSLREIWPTHRKQAIWAALIFAIYPSFDQQAISVAFSQHWICYLFYVASIWAMVKAVRTNTIAYGLLSYILAAIQLWTMEYFAALELLRPFVLLIPASETKEGWGKRLVFMLKRWLPYLVIFSAFVYWRMFLLEFPGEDPNPIIIFDQLRESPLTALWQFFELSFQDTLFTLFGVWNQTIRGRAIELDSPFFRLVIGISFLSAGVVWYALSSLRSKENDANPENAVQWGYQAMALGLTALLLGALPAWMAGRETTASFYSSRFSLASMFGAGLFIVGLLEWITPRYFVKITLVSTMILVTTNYHLRINDGYRDSWDAQKKFYWQLYWRAPYIEPNTPLISDNEVLLYAGGYATAMGMNLIYHEGALPENMAYWLFVLDDRLEGQMFRFRNQNSLEGELRNLHFSGESTDSLIIDNSNQGCLQVYADGRAENSLLSDALQQIVPVSDLSRIHPETDRLPPDPDIFGPEPDHTWCYYYEKADLARQLEGWEQVTRLGDEAINAGYAASDPKEWFVFIVGYGLTGNVDQAAALTQQVFETRGDYGLALCDLWKELADQRPGDIPLQNEWQALQGSSLCQTE